MNWVESRHKQEQAIKAGCDDIWTQLGSAIKSDVNVYNDLYCDSASRVDYELSRDRKGALLLTRKVLKSNPVSYYSASRMIQMYADGTVSMTDVGNPEVYRPVRVDVKTPAGDALGFFAGLEALSVEEASRQLIETFLFKKK